MKLLLERLADLSEELGLLHNGSAECSLFFSLCLCGLSFGSSLFLSSLSRCSISLSLCESFLLVCLVADLVDHSDNAEDAESNDKEVDDSLCPSTPKDSNLFYENLTGLGVELFGSDDGLDRVKASALEEDANEGVDDVVNKTCNDLAERAADNNADCHIYHVTAGDEFFEVRTKSALFLCHFEPPAYNQMYDIIINPKRLRVNRKIQFSLKFNEN